VLIGCVSAAVNRHPRSFRWRRLQDGDSA